MITKQFENFIRRMPKAENHIHIEGSIPLNIAIQLAEKNNVNLPYKTADGLKKWVKDTKRKHGLNGFMYCNRKINSVCINKEDFEAVVVAMAQEAKEQNIIYQELHLDYPLNEERGIPLDVVMDGYISAKKRAKEEMGVELVYIAGIDRTQSSENCLRFVERLEKYLDHIDGLGMDCEELGHPSKKHIESYKLGSKMGLYLTAHAGEEIKEEKGEENIWDALQLLKVSRIDHGCKIVNDKKLIKYIADNKILCTICPTANIGSKNVESYESHPGIEMLRKGIPCSINSDNPPYSDNLVENYIKAVDLMNFTEDELLDMARNAFSYSIKGQKYLDELDSWIEENRK